MSAMAKANETLAAQMKVALAVEQGPEEGTDSNKSSASPTEAVTEPSDTSSGLTGEQKGGLQSASSAASAFSAMSTTAKDVVDQASANGGPGGTGSGGKDTDDNGEYTLTDGFKDVCGIASRLMGWNISETTTSEDGAETSDDSDTYQVLQQMLADLQDQSWLIDQNQLSVCVRGDGSDMQLGQGSFGSVYKGVMNKSVAVAIKSIRSPSMRAKMEFVNEMAMLMNLRHQNIVQCLGAVIDRKNLLLVMELMPRGDLYRNLQRDREGILRWHKRGQATALDIVRGVLHMHDLGIVHQDIKSGNVMLNRDFSAKIGDVGLAAVYCHSDKAKACSSNPGTLEWCAPEVLQGKPASIKGDIYSLGVVLWELLTGEMPKRGDLRPLKSPDDCPQDIADIVEQCMESDPDLRPTTPELFDCLSSHSLPAGRALSAKQL